MRFSHKYSAKKTIIDGITFPSKKQAHRYVGLKLLEKGGIIQNLEMEVLFELTAHNVKICKYYADFVYTENDRKIIEDVKGMRTPVFNLKWKLLKAQFGDAYVYRIT